MFNLVDSDPATRPVCFELLAEAEPGVLPRVLVPFARRDLTPDTMRCRRVGAMLEVTVGMTAMPSEMVHLVEGNLRQLVGMRRVTVLLGGRFAAAA